MKHIKLFEQYIGEKTYADRIDRSQFKSIKPGTEITYFGNSYKVKSNDGYILTLIDSDGDEVNVNFNMFNQKGWLHENVQFDDLKEIVKMETKGAFKFGDPTEAAEKHERVFYVNHKNNKAFNQKFKDLATKAAKEAQKRLSVTYEIKQDIDDDDVYTLIVFDVTDM